MTPDATKSDIPERLIRSGMELFLEQGYNATGIQQITDNAGVPKGSFYNHFASKEAFAAAIVDRYELQSRQFWEHAISGAPEEPVSAIRHVFDKMITFHTNYECSPGCLIGNFSAEISASSELCRQHLMAANLAWRERLAVLVARAQHEGKIRNDIDAMSLSALVWSVWTGALLRMKSEQSITPLRDNTELVLDLLFGLPADNLNKISPEKTRSNKTK